jgi:hypothetical protein
VSDVGIQHGSLAPHRTGREDFPHPALPKTLITRPMQLTNRKQLQVHQPHAVEVFVIAHPCGWSKGSLASASCVLRKTLTYLGIDLPKPLTGIPIAKVVRPTLKMPVELFNQLRQRHKAALFVDHLPQPLPRSGLRAFFDMVTLR